MAIVCRYRPPKFATTALSSSRVAMTWDEPEFARAKVMKCVAWRRSAVRTGRERGGGRWERVKSAEELNEDDFRAYIASSDSDQDSDGVAEARASEPADAAAERRAVRAKCAACVGRGGGTVIARRVQVRLTASRRLRVGLGRRRRCPRGGRCGDHLRPGSGGHCSERAREGVRACGRDPV